MVKTVILYTTTYYTLRLPPQFGLQSATHHLKEAQGADDVILRYILPDGPQDFFGLFRGKAVSAVAFGLEGITRDPFAAKDQ